MTYLAPSIYVRNTDARHFDTINIIQLTLSLAQSMIKGGKAQIWRTGNRGVKTHFLTREEPESDRLLYELLTRPQRGRYGAPKWLTN